MAIIRAYIDKQDTLQLIDPSPFNLISGTVYDPCVWINNREGGTVKKFSLEGDMLTIQYPPFTQTVKLIDAPVVPVPASGLLFISAFVLLALVNRIGK